MGEFLNCIKILNGYNQSEVLQRGPVSIGTVMSRLFGTFQKESWSQLK